VTSDKKGKVSSEGKACGVRLAMLQFEERAEGIGKMKDSDAIRKAGIQENRNHEMLNTRSWANNRCLDMR